MKQLLRDERSAHLVSVVIVTYNGLDELGECLDSVDGSRAECGLELVVVDNHSVDGTVEALRARPPDALVENDSNLGFATAVNQGIRAASGQYILLLNPDARLNPGALRALVGFLDSHPSAAAVGPRITGANGALVRSCRVFPSLAVILARDTGLSDRFPRHPVFGAPTLSFWGYDSDRQVDYASGACLLLRRQAIEAVGLLDEGYFMYGEEMDLCWRLWRRG